MSRFHHQVLSAEESVMQDIQNKDLEALELTLQQYERVNIDFLSAEGITPLMHVIIMCAGTGGKGAVEVKLLQTLLQLHPNLSVQDQSEGRTALHWAVVFDLKELLMRLLEMGADYTLKDMSGMNAVHLAVEVNAENCLQTFLKYLNKEIFDLPDGLGRTCLIHAIQSEHSVRLSQKLISSGVSVNAQEHSKPFHSPLHAAALIDAKQIADLLLKLGADPTVVDDQGRIALHCAAMNPGGGVCPSILKSTPSALFDLPDKQGLTPFLLSAKYAAAKQMRVLIKRGVNTSARNVQGQTGFHLLAESSEGVDTPLCLSQLRDKEPTLLDARDHAGHTPLTFAASVGNDVVLSELLAARADVTVIDGENHVPLHWAAAGRNPLCVRVLTDYLKENGGDLNARDNRLATPLHYSVQLAAFTSGTEGEEGGANSTRALECCHVLLQAGSDPNAVDVSHSPPVLWAARYPHALAVIRLLQLSGAKIDIQNETGLSALHLAAQEGLVDTCRCLVEECAFPGSLIDNAGQTALFYALDHRHLECFQYLLSVGVYPDHQDLRDRTVAHLACVHGLIDFLRVLKEHRTNLDLPTGEGIRPAHEAVVNLQLECLRFLLVQCHYSADTRDKNGSSLLHYAADKGSEDMSRFLLESGADVNSVLSHGETGGKSAYYTPLDFARMKEHEELAAYLESKGGRKGEEVADRASRKIQKVLRRRVAEVRREHELAATATTTDTDVVSSESEVMKEEKELSDTGTSEGEDPRDSTLSPFHVPTPLRDKRYIPGLHMISLATPPLKFTPSPQLSSHPLPITTLPPPPPGDTPPPPPINTRKLQKQLAIIQDTRGSSVEEEESKLSAVSFLAAGAVAVLSATLGGVLGVVGLDAAGAALQGELDEMRKNVQQQREVENVPTVVQETRGTPVEVEDKKILDTILEHPDRETDNGEITRHKEMEQEVPRPSKQYITSDRDVRTRDVRGKIKPATVKDLCKDMERETERKLVKLKTESYKHDEQFWRECERVMAEASEVGKRLRKENEMRRENNRELEELLPAYGVSRRPTVAQWLERKREQKRLELQRELIQWDNDKKQREAYLVTAKRMSEERVARHSDWNKIKRLTLLNIREKQWLIDLQMGTKGQNDLFSRNFARNPYASQANNSRAGHYRPWADLHSYSSPKTSERRRPPPTQPLPRSPHPPIKPRVVSRPVTIRMTERGLLRITDSSHLPSPPKKRNSTTLDSTVAHNPVWLRATGPKNTPKSRPVIQLRPEEYVKLEKFRKNLALFPIPSSVLERSQLHRTLSIQSI